MGINKIFKPYTSKACLQLHSQTCAEHLLDYKALTGVVLISNVVFVERFCCIDMLHCTYKGGCLSQVQGNTDNDQSKFIHLATNPAI